MLNPARVQEVFDIAVDHARAHPGRRVMSVDKASVYATSRLWRRISHATSAATGVRDRQRQRRPRRVRTRQVRAAARGHRHRGAVRRHPVRHRVRAGRLAGAVRVGDDQPRPRGSATAITALFEPAHGSSPHRTGSRRSNPTGAWLALADLLAWCPDLAALGAAHRGARRARPACSTRGAPTYDLAAPGRADARPRPVQRARARRARDGDRVTTTPFRQLHHICLVVHDIDATQAYYESIGIGPWQEYPPLTEYTDLDVPNPRRVPADAVPLRRSGQRPAPAVPAARARLPAAPLPRHARRRRVPPRLRVRRRHRASQQAVATRAGRAHARPAPERQRLRLLRHRSTAPGSS